MKLTPNISIHEAAELLRDAYRKKFDTEIEAVIISSYDRARLFIQFDARVDSTDSASGEQILAHRWQQIGDFVHYTRPLEDKRP